MGWIGRKEPLEPEDDGKLSKEDDEGQEASLTQMLEKAIEEQMS